MKASVDLKEMYLNSLQSFNFLNLSIRFFYLPSWDSLLLVFVDVTTFSLGLVDTLVQSIDNLIWLEIILYILFAIAHHNMFDSSLVTILTILFIRKCATNNLSLKLCTTALKQLSVYGNTYTSVRHSYVHTIVKNYIMATIIPSNTMYIIFYVYFTFFKEIFQR